MNLIIEVLLFFQQMNTTEMMRIILIIGGFLALQFKSSQGITPGGIIIPGMLTMAFISSPLWAGMVIALSCLVYWVYGKIHPFLPEKLHRGRNPLFLLGFLTIFLSFFSVGVLKSAGLMHSGVIYGTFIPAIIGYLSYRQSFTLVIKGLLRTSLLTLGAASVIFLIARFGFDYEFTRLDVYQELYPVYTFKNPLALFLSSMLIGFILYRFSGIRAGGFIVTPIISSMLIFSPLNALLFLASAIAIYKIVDEIVKRGLLVGLYRYYLVLVLSIAVLWIVEYGLLNLGVSFTPFMGSSVFAVIALVAYVNDSMVYGPEKVVPLIAVSMFFVSGILLI